jgi:hypothetical protein
LKAVVLFWSCASSGLRRSQYVTTTCATNAMPPFRTTKSYTLANSPANNLHLHHLARTHGGHYSRKLNRSLPYHETSIRKPCTRFMHTLPSELTRRMEEVEHRATETQQGRKMRAEFVSTSTSAKDWGSGKRTRSLHRTTLWPHGPPLSQVAIVEKQ